MYTCWCSSLDNIYAAHVPLPTTEPMGAATKQLQCSRPISHYWSFEWKIEPIGHLWLEAPRYCREKKKKNEMNLLYRKKNTVCDKTKTNMKEFKYFAFIPVGGHKPKDLAKRGGSIDKRRT